ncbi:multi-sensor signal transduction histidine kinase [[Leptolyngbya] sp. PCC 7376]|uniref:sensor histidine kinase n=1 Tax=[Leptolyngbya] sp. PCC 7376 TaxID=111781 RepID=UPI00029F22A7|nr:ATP-binding protein [[Leptolyngbya] sp. PCC 7376]AFY37536.1 multi-sensor signal transduction histidine kinase [[Leptolyngbya] sp. PCC 7376]
MSVSKNKSPTNSLSPSFSEPQQQKVNIVVVDDERTNLKALELILSTLNHNIISLTSGQDALEFIKQKSADIALIILDIHMPIMDGFEVVKKIQDLQIADYIPIIFLTSSATESDFVFQGYENGAIDYLDRNIHPQVLRSKVSAFVELHQQSKKIREQTNKLRESNLALSKKIEEHQMTLAVVEEKEKELRNFFDHANDLIHSVDREGKFIYVNQCWLETLGYNHQDLDKLHFLDIIHPSYHQSSEEISSTLRRGLSLEQIELLFIGKYGNKIYVEGNINGNFDGEKYLSMIGIFRDITKRKEAEDRMRVALDKERQVAELQSRFVATASHEFRTPLTGILSSTELLQTYWDKLSHEEHQEYLAQIYDSVMLMRNLMNDVLLVSKAEAGRMECNPQMLNVVKTTQKIAEQINQRINKNHQISFVADNIDPEAEYCLDSKLLQLVFTNIVTNAMKYSSENSSIAIKVWEEGHNIHFEIKDQGEGIPLEDQPHVFDFFRRGKNTHDIPGTGLGLNIVKHCVDLHHGEISFVSELHVGTCFYFSLPTNINAD